MKMLIVTLFFVSHTAIAQTTTTLQPLNPKERAEQAYKVREEAFAKSQKASKIANERSKEIQELQKKMQARRTTLSDAFQSDLKKVADEERRVLNEINKKYDEMSRNNNK
jgi:hypothetical protein